MTAYPKDEELSAYLDGALRREEELSVRFHLDECASCRAKVKMFLALKDTIVHNVASHPVPPTLRKAISAQMRPAWRSFLLHPWRVRPALALVVLLVVIIGAGWWWKRSGERMGYAAITQALVAEHIQYTHTPDSLEITSADPGAVSAWFQDRVPFAVRIPPLSHGRLLGGRLCTPLGRLGAAVFYERDGRRISLFTLALDVLPPEERNELQVDGEKRPKCIETRDQYVLCLACADDAVRAVVAEGPEAGDLARMLFAHAGNMVNMMENRL